MQAPQRHDPILEEVRRNREELLRSSGGTLDSLHAMLQKCEATENRRVVKLPARLVERSDPSSAASDAA